MASYTLRQLKYFVTTVECGSMAEASRKLYIAQPSISTAVKGLEESFGVQLFIRHHAQGVSLTPAGARFYRKAQELLRMAHEFEQNALADNDVIAGQIDIGCFETVAPLYLPGLIAGFRQAYPGWRSAYATASSRNWCKASPPGASTWPSSTSTTSTRPSRPSR